MSVPRGSSQIDDAPTAGRRAASARTAWLAGALLGALAGFIVLVGGIIGPAFLAVVGALLLRTRAGLFGLGGTLTGLGGMWVAVFGRVKLTCSPATQCFAPTIDTWLLVGAAILALGLVSAVVATRRQAR